MRKVIRSTLSRGWAAPRVQLGRASHQAPGQTTDKGHREFPGCPGAHLALCMFKACLLGS